MYASPDFSFSVRRLTALVAFSIALIGGAPMEAQSYSSWGSSYTGGVRLAQSSSKPLLVVIAQDGCSACEALDVNLAKNPAAFRNAVRVRVAADRNPAITSRYAAGGTPTILVFTKNDGYSAPVYSYTGVMSSGDLRQLGRSIDKLAATSKRSR